MQVFKRFFAVFVLLGIAVSLLSGCAFTLTGPDFAGSEGIFSNDWNYTLSYEIIRHAAADEQEGTPPRTLTVHPNEYATLTLNEGRYTIKVYQSQISDRVFRTFTINVPAITAERIYEVETVRGFTGKYAWVVAVCTSNNGGPNFTVRGQ